jgi:biopolymer transport protein ExbD
MKKTSKKGHHTMNELNITPLLDLVFVLLVIFIITTPQMINSLTMNLPSGAKPPPPNPNQPKPKINQLMVDEKGQVFLNKEYIPRESLKAKLAELKASDPDPKVVVKGADEVDYQSMVVVLDALQQLDITKIGLATQ